LKVKDFFLHFCDILKWKTRRTHAGLDRFDAVPHPAPFQLAPAIMGDVHGVGGHFLVQKAGGERLLFDL
jgi:hypothetical protein